MKALYTFFLFLALLIMANIAQARTSQLQIDFDRAMDYVVQVGFLEFKSNGNSLFIDQMPSGFHPVQVFKQERRNRKLLYSGGVNLAENAITYTFFKRNHLVVEEVVSLYLPEIIVMNDATFEAFKKTVQQESFSSNKLELLENQLNFHFFTSQQISELVEILKFDSDQLKFAKIAYIKSADPQNYFVVVEKLKFSSSKRELNQHIQNIQLGK